MSDLDILFVGYSLKLGGAEKKLIETSEYFLNENKNVKIILLQNDIELTIPKKVEDQIIYLNHGFSIKSLKKMYEIVKELNPKYVFGFLGHVNVMLGVLKLFFPKVTFVGRENATYGPYFKEKGKVKGFIIKMLYRINLKNLDKIIFQSQYAKKEAISLFKIPDEKTYVLENPLQLSFKNEELEDNIVKNSFLLLSVGRLERVKNQKEMIDVLELLPDQYRLCFIGIGDEEKELKQYVSKKKLEQRVEFLGYVHNVSHYYRKAGLLLLTSFRETYPNVVLEASSHGLYTVSYVMPGAIREIIEENVNGSLVPSNNIVDLKNTILQKSGCIAKLPRGLLNEEDYFRELEKILKS